MISETEKQIIVEQFGKFIMSLKYLVSPEAVLYGSVGNAEIIKNNTVGRDLDEWNEIIKQAKLDVKNGVFAK